MKEKELKVKKQIPKKEKTCKVLWIIFTVILIIMIFFRYIYMPLLTSGNKAITKATLNVALALVDDSVEYTNDKGETHKYFISIDNSYFKKKSKTESGTPIIIKRQEKDGSMTKLKNVDLIGGKKEDVNEMLGVLGKFVNSGSEKLGFTVVKKNEKLSPDIPWLDTFSRVSRDIFIFYCIFFVIFSVFTYYQIWSRHYDEKQEALKEASELDIRYQKGISREEANVKRKPKKMTKKQMREIRKKK